MVSEAEMKEFFQRVIDQMAEYSTQASQVEGLRQHVQNLLERVNTLEADNTQLRDQLGEYADKINRAEQQAESFRSQLEGERNAVQALRETIYQRDQYVQELTTRHQQEVDAHKITASERDDARQKIAELEQAKSELYSSFTAVEADRNSWRDKAIDLEARVADLNTKLERVNSILNPLRAIPSADVA
jgi:chromosome segregation ATPase